MLSKPLQLSMMQTKINLAHMLKPRYALPMPIAAHMLSALSPISICQPGGFTPTSHFPSFADKTVVYKSITHYSPPAHYALTSGGGEVVKRHQQANEGALYDN